MTMPLSGDRMRRYRAMLGPARDSSVSPIDSGVVRHRWLWRDRATEFELIRFVPARDELQAMAILSNRVRPAP
jgi:hypothetical protein